MPREGTARRRRQREGKPDVKPGHVGWVHGSKLVFLSGYKEEYVKASEISSVKAGRFYDEVATEFLKKYGYHTPWEGDLDDGQDIASDVEDDEDVDSLPAEEAEERSQYYSVLREKIAVWFRTNCGGGSKKKSGKNVSFKTLFDKPELDPPAPTRARAQHFYSRRYYEERIKPRFEARWAVVSKQPNPPAAIVVQNRVTREAWAAESPAFKAEVKAAMETEFQAAMKAHEVVVSGEAPQTPQEHQIALDQAGYYLQPFVNAVHERFKMNVTLVICGPVPNRGGAIEMHSVHAGMTKGMVPRIWPEFDRAGFEATRQSFRDFSSACFTTEERRARSLNGMPEALPDASGSVIHSSSSTTTAHCLSSDAATATPTSGDSSVDTTATEADGGLPDEDDRRDDDDDDDDEEEEEDLTPTPQPPQPPQERDLEVTVLPELAAELAELGSERGFYEARLRRMSQYEFDRENTMARNRALAKSIFGDKFQGVGRPGGSGIGGAAPSKRKAAATEPGQTKKKKHNVAAPTTRQTRGQARGHGGVEDEAGSNDEQGPAPARPRPKPRMKVQDIRLVRPEDNSSAEGPLLVADIPLVRPEDDGSEAEGPLHGENPADVELVRPEDSGSAEGPLLVADIPLVRPEDDGSEAEGPLHGENPADVEPVCPEDSGSTEGPLLVADIQLVRPEDDGSEAEGPLHGENPADVEPVCPEDSGSAEGPLLVAGIPLERVEDDIADEAVGEDDGGLGGVEDEDKWPKELRNAVNAFGRLKVWGGQDWSECIELLVALERAWGFPEKGLVAAPAKASGRPPEVAAFMQWARRWETRVELSQKAIGPREEPESFAALWWAWWRVMQPPGRVEGKALTRPDHMERSEWSELAKTHGRNGILLVVGCLLWWGEAAKATNEKGELEQWLLAVSDVKWALRETLKGVEDTVGSVALEKEAKKSKGKGVAKRSAITSSSSREKENERPSKRQRRS
ncbi:hypothetical protein B0H15DRAFT_801079 [Mycena belliarum]|uniref:Uncharacterized protein n=1 Tax=Mycena belliarum TaxID=1033014 RepID=A0AAD6U351_9AGAR|nr:hypothetical protein B0H15DRAFT_801079 [Mycena belliae]